MIDESIFLDMQRVEAYEIDGIIGLIREKRYMEAMARLKRMSDVKKFRSGKLLAGMVA